MRLRFTVFGREVETAAEVRHSSPGIGIGVEFVRLDPEVRAAIELLLSRADSAGESVGS